MTDPPIKRPKVIFLTGAPQPEELQADELSTDVLPAVERFLYGSTTSHLPDPTSSNNWPNWRSLDTGDDERHGDQGQYLQANEQFSFVSIASQQQQDNADYDFFEHSLITYTMNEKDNLDDTVDFSTYAGESFISDLTEDSLLAATETQVMKPPSSVTDLRRLPHATVVEKSYPQTITVDLVVAIISISAAKTITTRKTGIPRQLIEVVVADETKTSFTITFWLPTPRIPSLHDQTLQKKLSQLRLRQIVLLTNIVLRAYDGRVYGQSQGNQRGKAVGTNILRVDGEDATLLGPQLLSKLNRVQDWMWQFLQGTTPARVGRTKTAGNAHNTAYQTLVDQDSLPPDTP